MDFKKEDDLIYVVGNTYNELGGSCYLDNLGFIGSSVPVVNLKQAKAIFKQLSAASARGLVKAMHDCSDGACFGGCLTAVVLEGTGRRLLQA